ncbi:hypothetical protein HYU96_04410 [Candidatus Daviesbacteria bacterium]|nr:hypothetical protein [Candidatus Daviesbacteria bacterium]
MLELFYNSYNGSGQEFTPLPQPVRLNAPKPVTAPPPAAPPLPAPQPQPAPLASQVSKTHPFMVEELEE